MVTRGAPPRLSAGERARRAARGGGSRSVPAPLLVPALIAAGFLTLPLAFVEASGRPVGFVFQDYRLFRA